MAHQIPLTPESIADLPHPDDGTREVASDLAYRRLALVNVAFFGPPHCGDRQWVLIDAGVTGLAGRIERAAEERFGKGARPAAIIMTHGHFDHVGCLEKLAEKWDAPIYAHDHELPYLNGTAAYTPPDTKTGGGIMPLLAPLFPRGPINVSRWLHALPADNTIPAMPDWRWCILPVTRRDTFRFGARRIGRSSPEMPSSPQRKNLPMPSPSRRKNSMVPRSILRRIGRARGDRWKLSQPKNLNSS
jgi:glyoxylase-like metal-dependent hydrolase (beta-lactamase superfamily II)